MTRVTYLSQFIMEIFWLVLFYLCSLAIVTTNIITILIIVIVISFTFFIQVRIWSVNMGSGFWASTFEHDFEKVVHSPLVICVLDHFLRVFIESSIFTESLLLDCIVFLAIYILIICKLLNIPDIEYSIFFSQNEIHDLFVNTLFILSSNFNIQEVIS